MSVVSCENIAGTSTFPLPEVLLGPSAGSTALVYCRDWQGRVLAANQAFARKFGCSAAELPGRPVSYFVHVDDTRLIALCDAELRQAPHRTTRDTRWLTPQGWRWIAWEETTLVDDQGRTIGARAMGHDITRQRVAEEQFYKLSCAVEQSPVAMVITDAEGQVQYVNAKFTEATGHTLEHILDSNIAVLREGHPNDAAYMQFWETVRSGRPWRGELSRDRPDGKRVRESVQVSCLRNATGEVTNLLCMREDVTERRALEDQLRQAQKMESLGTLAGGIAHDFNNLIAVINGFAELLLLKPGDQPTVQKCVREIRRASERASGLVRQILTFSRKADVRFAPIDLNKLCRDLVGLLAATFPRNISFNFALDDKLPPLMADQNQLQQVILNLCVNARDAMPAGGAITLTTTCVEGDAIPAVLSRDRAYACLAASDTGTGMTPEVRARIFEPFFTTKPSEQGTGLGLAVVYGIVASHEGTIDVESAPGSGSTFKIYLPLADRDALSPVIAKSAEFPSGAESLLIVEDEAPLRLLLEASLGSKGYQVITAADGLGAIEKIRDKTQSLDGVLLDLNLPLASGIDVLRVIKECRPGVTVVILAGELTADLCAEFEWIKPRHFVKKPYTIEQVGRRLRDLIEESKAST